VLLEGLGEKGKKVSLLLIPEKFMLFLPRDEDPQREKNVFLNNQEGGGKNKEVVATIEEGLNSTKKCDWQISRPLKQRGGREA